MKNTVTEAEWEEIKLALEQAKGDIGPFKCKECQCNICRRYVDLESCNEYSFDRELDGCEKGGCITCNGHIRNNCDDFIINSEMYHGKKKKSTGQLAFSPFP
ncbi:hypothetical protein [Desulfotomaculum copahuensis]|uniref:hypothetical protein n=1 Tax=Desulfotomaculum copahuensis TaxID=1838280 RepID=UPI00124604AC|nr:hypothetical protein [Desulfotomaculum copahuensis]